MSNLQELADEFSKYEIPNSDEIISWFINGDKNATLENWHFYQRCIFGMLHFDEHIDNICAVKKNFDTFELRIGKKRNEKNEDRTQLLKKQKKDLINEILTSETVSINSLLESNELLRFIVMCFNSHEPSLGHHSRDQVLNQIFKQMEKKDELDNSIKKHEELMVILSETFNNIQENKKVSSEYLKYLKDQCGIKTNIFMAKEQKLHRINGKKEEVNKELSQLKIAREEEQQRAKKEIINIYIDYFNDIISEYGKNPIFEKWKDDFLSLSEEQIHNISTDSLVGIANYFYELFRYLSDNNKNLKEFKKDLTACAKLFKEFWNKNWSEGKDFNQICQNIRNELSAVKVPSDARIVRKFRDEVLSSDNDGFIQGASLNNEQIQKGMSILSHKFDEIMKIENPKEYVSECAKLLHDFIMIHPYADGNGRTSRLLLQTMLLKKDIIIPSLFDSYYHRPNWMFEKISMRNGNTNFDYLNNFSTAENLTSYTNDYKYIVDYIIHRVQKFNPNLIKMVTEESIKTVSEGVDKSMAENMVCSIIAEIENAEKGVALDEPRSGKSIH